MELLFSQISLTSNLNVLPRFFLASSWYSFGIITMIFSPIVLILPVNFIITFRLSIHLYIYYLKYTDEYVSILNIERIQRYTMNTTQTQEINSFADEIFVQLKASRVSGFPFFAYTGIKASIFSEESLYLKLPKNPSKFKSILVTYDLGSDTYIVSFYTHDDPLKDEDRHTDIYFDQLADLIVSEMGVN